MTGSSVSEDRRTIAEHALRTNLPKRDDQQTRFGGFFFDRAPAVVRALCTPKEGALSMSQTVQTVAEKAAPVATYGGSSVAFIGGLTANEVAAVGGLAIGVVGLLVNVWFRWQHLKLARERQEASDEAD